MTAKFKVEKNVPMPNFSPRRASGIYPFDSMTEVGDSFAVPYETRVTGKGNESDTYTSLRGTIAQRNKRHPEKQFNLIHDEANGVVRVFLVSIANDEADVEDALEDGE